MPDNDFTYGYSNPDGTHTLLGPGGQQIVATTDQLSADPGLLGQAISHASDRSAGITSPAHSLALNPIDSAIGSIVNNAGPAAAAIFPAARLSWNGPTLEQMHQGTAPNSTDATTGQPAYQAPPAEQQPSLPTPVTPSAQPVYSPQPANQFGAADILGQQRPSGGIGNDIGQLISPDEIVRQKRNAIDAEMAANIAKNATVNARGEELNESAQNAFASDAAQRKAVMDQAAEYNRQDQALLAQRQAEKIDPDRVWANKSAGQKSASIISQILGGFVQGFTGGKVGNVGLEMLKDERDRDIEAQKDNMSKNRELLSTQMGMHNRATALGMDNIASTRLANMDLRNTQQQMLKLAADQTTDQQAKANAQAAIAGLAEENNKDAMALNTYRVDQAQKKLGIARESEALGMQKLQDEIAKNALAGQLAVAKGGPEILQHLKPEVQQAYINSLQHKVGGPDGSLGAAQDEGSAKDFNDEAKPAQTIIQILDRIDAARKSGVVPNQSELDALTGGLQQATADLGGTKESSRNEEIIQSMIGDPSQYFGIRPSANWTSRERGLQELANDRIKLASARHQISWIRKPKAFLDVTRVGP